MAVAMAANGQSRVQKLRPHRQGTTTTSKGNQFIGCFKPVLFFVLVIWHDHLPNVAAQWRAAEEAPISHERQTARPLKQPG